MQKSDGFATVNLDDVAVRTNLENGAKQVLLSVWGKLPRDAKASIVKHWKTPPYSDEIPPTFSEWPLPRNHPEEGRTTQRGFYVELKTSLMNRGGEPAERLVAHELAHVHDWAGNGPTKDNPLWAEVTCDTEATIQMERYAAMTAMSWKFLPPTGESVDEYIARIERSLNAGRA